MICDYGYGRPSIGFLRFCDDPELACCQAEKDYLRLKAQEINLYEKAMELEYEFAKLQAENAKLRKVADAARALAPNEMYQCTRHLYALKHTLDEYDKAKEGQE
jgi:hypothetical protein